MHSYEIDTGIWRDSQKSLLGVGYSGNGQFKNDPASISVKNHGPLPIGFYRICEPVDTEEHGPYVLPLIPDPANEMYGRSGFLVHGDSKTHPGTASQGCIILPRAVRERIWNSGDRDLEVISGLSPEL